MNSFYKYLADNMPTCRYCGKLMGRILCDEELPQYVCSCGARTPFPKVDILDKQATIHACDVVDAANRIPPKKPLTLDEVKTKYNTVMWIEFDGNEKPTSASHWYLWSGVFGYHADIMGYMEPWKLPMKNYGKTWRCWAAEPTREERSCAEWQ